MGPDDLDHCWLRAQPCHHLREDHRRHVRSLWDFHPHPAHPHRRQQLRQLLQEQDVEDRGCPQEEREDEAAGQGEEGDAEDDAFQGGK